jgi:hypothetical protein
VNALAFYANSILWLYLVLAFEQRGYVWAHKVRILIGQNYGCRCAVCHPGTNARLCDGCERPTCPATCPNMPEDH